MQRVRKWLTFVGVSTSHPLAFLVVGVYVIVWLAFDVVLGKALRVLPETELLKPVSDLLHRGNAPGLSGLTRPHRRVYPERVQRWSRGRDLLAARKSASLQDITTSSARWKR